MRFLLRSEKGQASAEFALAAPILLVLMFFAMQYAWVVYCGSVLSEAIDNTRLTIEVSDVTDSNEVANRTIEKKLLESRPILSTGELTVSNARITSRESTVRTVELDDEDFKDYMIATANELSKRVEVSADIVYRPMVILPLLPEMSYSRTMEASVIAQETFELG